MNLIDYHQLVNIFYSKIKDAKNMEEVSMALDTFESIYSFMEAKIISMCLNQSTKQESTIEKN